MLNYIELTPTIRNLSCLVEAKTLKTPHKSASDAGRCDRTCATLAKSLHATNAHRPVPGENYLCAGAPADASLAAAFRRADDSSFWCKLRQGGKTRLLLRFTRALCLRHTFFTPTTFAGLLSPAVHSCPLLSSTLPYPPLPSSLGILSSNSRARGTT